MKLHLPKVLFAAVVMACSVAQAATTNAYSITLNGTTYGNKENAVEVLTGGTGPATEADYIVIAGGRTQISSDVFTNPNTTVVIAGGSYKTSNDAEAVSFNGGQLFLNQATPIDNNFIIGSSSGYSEANYNGAMRLHDAEITLNGSITLVQDATLLANRNVYLNGALSGNHTLTLTRKGSATDYFYLSGGGTLGGLAGDANVAFSQYKSNDGSTAASGTSYTIGNLTTSSTVTVDSGVSLTIGNWTVGKTLINNGTLSLTGTITLNSLDNLEWSYTGYEDLSSHGEFDLYKTYKLVSGTGTLSGSTTTFSYNGGTYNVADGYSAEAGKGYFVATGTVTVGGDNPTEGTADIDLYYVNSGATLLIAGNPSNITANEILGETIGDGNITVDCNFVFTNGSSSKAKGTLTIEEGHTLELGEGTVQVVSIASFNQVVLNGSTLKLHNNGTTIQNLTVDKASTLHIQDTDKTNNVPNNMHLTGVTTLNAELDVTNAYKGQLTIDSLTGTGNLDIDLANNAYVYNGDCVIVNINGISNYSGIISYKPAVCTDATQAATHANNRITITSTDKGFSVGGLEVTGGVHNNRTASGAATIDIGGDTSLGAVKLGQGSSLTIFNRKAAGARDGIHTVTMDSLAVDGSAMIQTQRNSSCYNGTINIGKLTGTDATLTLKNGSQTDDATVFNINGGSYAGTINLEADSAKGSGAPNRKLHMYVNNATALQSAVINFQDPSTATATDKAYNYITFGVGIDNAKVAGITGTTTNAAVIKSTEGTRSLEINVAEDQKYASNAKVENSINLVKTGAGEQAFSSDMSTYTGAVKVSGGKLALTNAAEGANTTLTSLTLDGGALDVTGTLTLSNVTVDLSKYTAGKEVELVKAGAYGENSNFDWTLANADAVGNYAASLDRRESSVWLTWQDTTPSVSSITTSVSTAEGWYTLSTDGTTTTLTLTVDGSLAGLAADGSVMVHLLTDKQLSAIMGDKNYNPYVLLELTDSDENTVTADAFNKVVFIKGETGQNYWGEMVDFGGEVGTKLAYNVERIPEPASATLSLAALMMLCARRRRRA